LYTFVGRYSLSELTGTCGGTVTSDAFGANLITQRTVVDVPIYVSYVYTKPGTGFSALNQVVNARFEMSYTTTLTTKGRQHVEISGGSYAAQVSSSVSSVGVDEATMNLEIAFSTEAAFRGSVEAVSALGPDGNALTIEATGSRRRGATQTWRLTTTTPKSDFSGDYTARFNPCVIPAGAPDGAACQVLDEAIEAVFPVAFVQADTPIAAEFQLNSDFYLMFDQSAALRPRDTSWANFLSKSELGHSSTYTADETVFGRVSSRSPLSSGITLGVNSVFLCAKDPNNLEAFSYSLAAPGCLDDNQVVESLTLVSGGQAVADDEIVANSMLSGAFGVQTRDGICGNCDLGNGDDVFSFAAAPLAQGSGYRWYSQVEYSVTAGRKRAGQTGADVKEVRFGGEARADTVLLQASLNIEGISKDVFIRDGQADFVLATAAQLGVAPSSVRVVGVTANARRTSTISVTYTVRVAAEDETRVANAMNSIANEDLADALESWNGLFAAASLTRGSTATKKTETRPTGETTELGQGTGGTSGSSSGGDDGSSPVAAIAGAVVGVVVLAGVAVFFKRNSGTGDKVLEKGTSAEDDVDDIEISLHGSPGRLDDGVESSV
jgi:hypothetical protein